MPTELLTQEMVFALYNADELSKFKDEAELKKFVDSLDYEKQKQLATWLSTCRKNQVAEVVGVHAGNWKREMVSIDRIIINRINKDVDPLLKRCEFRLDRIAKDQEIVGHREFKRNWEITRKEFIAKRVNEDFQLSDGNHRAVMLAIAGCDKLTLVYPE